MFSLVLWFIFIYYFFFYLAFLYLIALESHIKFPVSSTIKSKIIFINIRIYIKKILLHQSSELERTCSHIQIALVLILWLFNQKLPTLYMFNFLVRSIIDAINMFILLSNETNLSIKLKTIYKNSCSSLLNL